MDEMHHKVNKNEDEPPAKRKRVVLSLEDKIKVIKAHDDGFTYEAIGNQYNIGVTTVKDIVGRRGKIEQAVSKNRYLGVTRKVLKEGMKPDVEEELYSYAANKIDSGHSLTSKDLIEKASSINLKLYNQKWTPSKGWLGKFKARYNLSSKQLQKDDDQTIIIEDPENETIEVDCSSLVDQSLTQNHEKVEKVTKISVLSAADVLLDFMNENDFPLKEIITVRVIRDKLNNMPTAQTMYEVIDQEDSVEESIS